jgi:hypothetical protein
MTKYEPLHERLRRAAGTVELTFQEIDALVGGLPPSARRHREWWGNSVNETHRQAAAWLAAGAAVEHVSLERERVRFRRTGSAAAPIPDQAPAPAQPGEPDDLQVAGSVSLRDALSGLALSRPVFHSEADLQHALAWQIHAMDPALHVRLETRPLPGMRLDLQVSSADRSRHTALELKYLTKAWAGTVSGEHFELKSQGAQDIAGYDVVKDIWRVERATAAGSGWNGGVLVLSNDSYYWRARAGTRPTNADAFRLHDGALLSGARAWGPLTGQGTRAGRDVDLVLTGTYQLRWHDYAHLQPDTPSSTFRSLLVVAAR